MYIYIFKFEFFQNISQKSFTEISKLTENFHLEAKLEWPPKQNSQLCAYIFAETVKQPNLVPSNIILFSFQTPRRLPKGPLSVKFDCFGKGPPQHSTLVIYNRLGGRRREKKGTGTCPKSNGRTDSAQTSDLWAHLTKTENMYLG